MVIPRKDTLQDMCARYAITPRALRYYEYIELITPDREGRTRYYGPREHARLKMILQAKRLGFPLEDVRQWLNLYDGNQNNPAQMCQLAERAAAQAETLRRKIAAMTDAVEELTKIEAYAQAQLALK